jgi:tol-pal system protein YbgF
MTVGVALSVAPIFNYALAQQGDNSTQLLLQVQAMRQEIGELRDLIERQQFQLRRLQKQSEIQSVQLEVIQGATTVVSSRVATNDTGSPSYNGGRPQAAPPSTLQTLVSGSQQVDQSTESIDSDQSLVPVVNTSPQSTWDVATRESNQYFYRLNTPSQGVSQGAVSVASQNTAVSSSAATTPSGDTAAVQRSVRPTGSLSSDYPPVVDRSFTTSSQAVPVTGAGTQQPAQRFEEARNSQVTFADNAQISASRAAAVNAPAQAINTQAQVVSPQAQAINTQTQVVNTQAQAVSPQAQVVNTQAQVVNTQAQAVSPQAQVANTQAQVVSPQAQVVSATNYATNTAGQNQVVQNSPIQTNQVPQRVATVTGSGGVVGVPSQIASPSSQAQASTSAGGILGQASTGVISSQAQAVLTQPSAPVVLPEQDYYAQGFELLKQSKYEQAASVFEQQLTAHPRGDLADDAHYWIAEAMHVSRRLDVAKVHLKAIISDYPQSRRVPDAMLKTAYIEQSQGNQIEARILFQEVVNMHPQSDAAIAAKNQLAAAN